MMVMPTVCGLANRRGWKVVLPVIATHVFRDDLLEGLSQNLPGEHLDILLDVAGLGVRECHDDLEELLALCLGLADCLWAETFQIATDPVLFLDREPVGRGDKLLQQVDSINTSDKALILLRVVDAADANAVRRALIHSHGFEGGCQGRSCLRLLEHHDPPAVLPLFLVPTSCHRIKISCNLQNSLGRVQSVWVELAGAWRPRAL